MRAFFIDTPPQKRNKCLAHPLQATLINFKEFSLEVSEMQGKDVKNSIFQEFHTGVLKSDLSINYNSFLRQSGAPWQKRGRRSKNCFTRQSCTLQVAIFA